jgi:hypothetical protein
VIDAPQGIDQFTNVPSDPDMGICEMPRGNYDLHKVALKGTTVAEIRVLACLVKTSYGLVNVRMSHSITCAGFKGWNHRASGKSRRGREAVDW